MLGYEVSNYTIKYLNYMDKKYNLLNSEKYVHNTYFCHFRQAKVKIYIYFLFMHWTVKFK